MVSLSLYLLREVMPIRSPLKHGSVKSVTTVRKLELSHAYPVMLVSSVTNLVESTRRLIPSPRNKDGLSARLDSTALL